MEKLFALARELGALNALGTCTLSRSQFTQLITREFPLCELKHVNRLFSCYDWEIRDSVDTRIVLGTLRAMRVQQGESVELICASLRDFDGTTDSNGKNGGDNEALVSDGVSLIKALSLCCGSDEEEKDMEARADAIWTTTLSWQRQILSRRLHGGMWKPKQVTWSVVNSSTVSRNSGDDDTLESVKDADDDDEEDTKEDTPELMRLVDESRVPVRRIREALKREQDTLALFTQQLLQQTIYAPAASSTVAMSKTVGVPISLLHEGEGRTVTIELKNGEVYRGHLTESEDSMNCQLSDVVLTQRDGQKSKLELVYVRGSQIKLVILPDILKNSPLLSKVQALSKKKEDSKKKKSGKSQGRRRTGPGARK
ncbi:hypothetical protein JG687_00016896 [Phytophthora cactorum]|uniref:Sm domain-containing protein n=1 Tax=Phytophthora cactorum TaxID=29920 RepID=A0A8T1TPR9_9STRA|nr:hypothetical protein JG687_00016896 [Phytophthora cactorum]